MLGVTFGGSHGMQELEGMELIARRRSRITIMDRRALEESSNGTYLPAER